MQSEKLNVSAFGMTGGLLWGFGVFFLTWWLMIFDGATKEKTPLGRIYRGYEVSPMGSIIGLLWALADGAIGGVIFAWLYNLFTVDKNPLVVTQPIGSEARVTATH